MDQLDNFNRKVWNDLYLADVFGHGMDLIKDGHEIVSQIRNTVEKDANSKVWMEIKILFSFVYFF